MLGVRGIRFSVKDGVLRIYKDLNEYDKSCGENRTDWKLVATFVVNTELSFDREDYIYLGD